MTRVATIPLQQTMAGAIQRAQQKLAVTQEQLSTGKKAKDFASLGTETVRNLSSRTLLARQEAHAAVTGRVSNTLALYDAHVSEIDNIASTLRQSILTAIGTQRAPGLQDEIESAFGRFRAALNAAEGGVPLFAGSMTDQKPFKPEKLADTIGLAPADAFANDDVRASARVSDDLDVEYGITASEVGTDLVAAFRTLAEAGNIGEMPTTAQLAALSTAVGQINTALTGVRGVNAENGRTQAQVETLATRAESRALLLKDIIERNEDADLGQVAIDLAQQKTTLEASYSVFSQLANLSLVSYIR